MRIMPEKLLDIAEWLGRKKIGLARGNENRRIDSTKSHTEILQLLQRQKAFGISPYPKATAGWYSFQVPDGGKNLSVKLKVSSFSRADNLNCKLGIYYALTGVTPAMSEATTWDRFFQMLALNLDYDCQEDFFFLVVNRLDPSDIFCNSLKGLSDIQPNGSNLPFQCKWSDNREPSQRSNQDATKYILAQFEKSAKLRAEMLDAYNNHFPA